MAHKNIGIDRILDTPAFREKLNPGGNFFISTSLPAIQEATQLLGEIGQNFERPKGGLVIPRTPDYGGNEQLNPKTIINTIIMILLLALAACTVSTEDAHNPNVADSTPIPPTPGNTDATEPTPTAPILPTDTPSSELSPFDPQFIKTNDDEIAIQFATELNGLGVLEVDEVGSNGIITFAYTQEGIFYKIGNFGEPQFISYKIFDELEVSESDFQLGGEGENSFLFIADEEDTVWKTTNDGRFLVFEQADPTEYGFPAIPEKYLNIENTSILISAKTGEIFFGDPNGGPNPLLELKTNSEEWTEFKQLKVTDAIIYEWNQEDYEFVELKNIDEIRAITPANNPDLARAFNTLVERGITDRNKSNLRFKEISPSVGDQQVYVVDENDVPILYLNRESDKWVLEYIEITKAYDSGNELLDSLPIVTSENINEGTITAEASSPSIEIRIRNEDAEYMGIVTSSEEMIKFGLMLGSLPNDQGNLSMYSVVEGAIESYPYKDYLEILKSAQHIVLSIDRESDTLMLPGKTLGIDRLGATNLPYYRSIIFNPITNELMIKLVLPDYYFSLDEGPNADTSIYAVRGENGVVYYLDRDAVQLNRGGRRDLGVAFAMSEVEKSELNGNNSINIAQYLPPEIIEYFESFSGEQIIGTAPHPDDENKQVQMAYLGGGFVIVLKP